MNAREIRFNHETYEEMDNAGGIVLYKSDRKFNKVKGLDNRGTIDLVNVMIIDEKTGEERQVFHSPTQGGWDLTDTTLRHINAQITRMHRGEQSALVLNLGEFKKASFTEVEGPSVDGQEAIRWLAAPVTKSDGSKHRLIIKTSLNGLNNQALVALPGIALPSYRAGLPEPAKK